MAQSQRSHTEVGARPSEVVTQIGPLLKLLTDLEANS
jgi:hypothetical protein